MAGLLVVLGAVTALMGMLLTTKAWAVVRGIALLLLALASIWVADANAPVIGYGSRGFVTRAGPTSWDLGMVMTSFAVAFVLLGAWQLLLGIVRVVRRGPVGILMAVTLIGCLLLVAILPVLLLFTLSAPMTAAY
jgi:hypothetical protein